MNKNDFIDPPSRISQIKKEQVDLIKELMRHSNFVSIFDDNDIRHLIMNHQKKQPEISKLIKREPPVIAPPKITIPNIQSSPAQNRVNQINALENFTLLFKYKERVIHPTYYAAVDNEKIRVVGIEKLDDENDIEAGFVAHYNDIEVFIVEMINGELKIHPVKFS